MKEQPKIEQTTGYTPEEKAEALKQPKFEIKEKRQEVSLNQQMESFFDRHNQEAKRDRENTEYFNAIEEEYRDGHLEIPLAQVQYESALLNKDAKVFSEENNQQKLLETRAKTKELNYLQNALSEKLEISKKPDLIDLTECLRQSQKQYGLDMRENPKDTLSHSQFVKYNRLVEDFDPENFNPKIWKEVLTEVDNAIIELEGSRDDILRDLASKKLDAYMVREGLKDILIQQAEFKGYKELLEKGIYGSGKSEEEKQKIDKLREEIKEKPEEKEDLKEAKKKLAGRITLINQKLRGDVRGYLNEFFKKEPSVEDYNSLTGELVKIHIDLMTGKVDSKKAEDSIKDLAKRFSE